MPDSSVSWTWSNGFLDTPESDAYFLAMQSAGPITIYHLSRGDGTALFVHPLMKPGSMLELGSDTTLTGMYGREPRVESVTMLRNELYRRIEDDVRDWINERRFIPRFLIAAAAFLVVYLFLAVVIRDPLPVVDESVVGLGAGILTFVLVGRRFEQSRTASQRRVALRSKVDSVVFSENRFVHRAEDLLQHLESVGPTERPSTDLEEEAAALRRDFPEQSAELLAHVRHLVAVEPNKKLSRQMRSGRISAAVSQQIDQGLAIPAAVHMLHLLQRAG